VTTENHQTEHVTMYSPSDYTGDGAFCIVEQCANLHDARITNRVGAEFVIEVPNDADNVTSFVVWLEGYGFHRR